MIEKVKESKNNYLIFYLVVLLIIVAASFLPYEDIPVLTTVPAIFLLFYVFFTKRVVEALFVSSLLGYVMSFKFGVVVWSDFMYEFNAIIEDPDFIWMVITTFALGGVISLIEESGGVNAFGKWVAKRVTTGKGSLIGSWILGCMIFIDDYLNCLAVGSCMVAVTDKHKVSREYLAYVVDSTAATMATLFPVSIWATFIATLIAQNGLAAEGEGMLWFIRSIPFNFYAIAAVIIVPLFILGIIPLYGPMKKAEKRAKETGQLAPPGSEKIDLRGGEGVKEVANAKVMNFILPLIVLIAATMYFEIDLQAGAITTIIFMFFLFIPQKIMDPERFVDALLRGMKNLLLPLFLVVLAYLFGYVCETIGFMDFAINVSINHVPAVLLPATIFAVFAITEFVMGLSWGMYIIAFPIVIPLALQFGINPAILIGAVISAGVWGSNVCFYSDATILTSAATGCNNFDHAYTQAPLSLLAAVIALVGYLVVGFVVIKK